LKALTEAQQCGQPNIRTRVTMDIAAMAASPKGPAEVLSTIAAMLASPWRSRVGEPFLRMVACRAGDKLKCLSEGRILPPRDDCSSRIAKLTSG
jgi:hypothetical protein